MQKFYLTKEESRKTMVKRHWGTAFRETSNQTLEVKRLTQMLKKTDNWLKLFNLWTLSIMMLRNFFNPTDQPDHQNLISINKKLWEKRIHKYSMTNNWKMTSKNLWMINKNLNKSPEKIQPKIDPKIIKYNPINIKTLTKINLHLLAFYN